MIIKKEININDIKFIIKIEKYTDAIKKSSTINYSIEIFNSDNILIESPFNNVSLKCPLLNDRLKFDDIKNKLNCIDIDTLQSKVNELYNSFEPDDYIHKQSSFDIIKYIIN